MSILTCQIGQCGNQLGQAFYDKVADELTTSDTYHQLSGISSHFHLDKKSEGSFNTNSTSELPIANSIQIDMEPKVINSLLERPTNLWAYDRNLSFSQQEGSGNNWAYGFYDHGPSCSQQMLNKFRILLEKHDLVEGVLFLQSLAGGTGSGIGSYLMGLLKDEYPELSLFTSVVLPRLSGEVILQFYNCVFSLSTIYQNCDGIFFFDNDSVERNCKKLYQIKRPNFKDMNFCLSQNLASFFFPTRSVSGYKPFEYQIPLLSNSYNKLLGLRTVPQMPQGSKGFTADTWNGLSNRLFQMLIGGSNEAEIKWNLKPNHPNIYRTNGLLQMVRGDKMENQDLSSFVNQQIYTRRLISPNVQILRDGHKFDGNDKTLTMVSNTAEFNGILDQISEKAHSMFQAKAFMHSYKKYGLEEDNIVEFLTIFEQIIEGYKQI